MIGSGNLVEKRVKEPVENTATDIRQTNTVAQGEDYSPKEGPERQGKPRRVIEEM